MRIELFDFDLPDHSIALRPTYPRDFSRLMVAYSHPSVHFSHHRMCDLLTFLKPNDVIIFNNTKVIPAQLQGFRVRQGYAEVRLSILLHVRISDDSWRAFPSSGKKIRQGDTIYFSSEDKKIQLSALVLEKHETGEITLVFSKSGEELDAQINIIGKIPLPPYIIRKRSVDEHDVVDYQTIYGCVQGAVAAPTAGLHFTSDLLDNLDVLGVEKHFVTLHVGAGTFIPVRVDNTDNHVMHGEIGYIDVKTVQAVNAAKAEGRRIIAVGTTTLRLLESAAIRDGVIKPWSGSTEIFITPGYRFRIVDMLITNFHLPRSTLFMLVAAFYGLEEIKKAYEHAIMQGYRFYSYGDASLLFRKEQ
ncbi:S-adenosylmethionine:tRNA ribosyltransferase-isomerase [Liberibacter crescens BT-1]|uniref:S-adenosylmethionine:tRNA ribosyltransferase-isomerase n=1 Tax=Liberibacter crescens (strain BT-1) TaxID=1215343 RepID=L0EVN4_LIBCB|nr:tRNA preQ1(34) S-adenosylmethionine ribosyltransferase-isomerase QueA [Liberibacter crescens]AGA64920.1 S-adenosylmethionine:tRNA ribosyltransferase-isomerase [Liberibacter crescens BT-1]AMC12945.1 S-adenosylmethionine tRNA ribosyltransferase [Liberibacter crescens]